MPAHHLQQRSGHLVRHDVEYVWPRPWLSCHRGSFDPVTNWERSTIRDVRMKGKGMGEDLVFMITRPSTTKFVGSDKVDTQTEPDRNRRWARRHWQKAQTSFCMVQLDLQKLVFPSAEYT